MLLPNFARASRRFCAVIFALGFSLNPAFANDQTAQALQQVIAQERAVLAAIGANKAKKIAGIGKNAKVRIASTSQPISKRPKVLIRKANMVTSFKQLSNEPKAKGDAQWACLTEALYFEARGESFKGITAVAEVILNRRNSKKFPNSICGVISQGVGGKPGCQFSYKCDGLAERYHEKKAYDRVAKIARLVLDDRMPKVTGGALFYHTTAVNPRWARKFRRTAQVGVHLFYHPS